MPTPQTPQSQFAAASSPLPRLLSSFIPALAIVLLLGGCSSNTSKPTVTAITVTDSNGAAQPAITALVTGRTVTLDATVTGDVPGNGIDWSVTCPSAVPLNMIPAGTLDLSCGFFTPGHTLSAPVPSFATTGAGYVTVFTAPAVVPKGGTVTLIAHSTSLPSRSKTLVLTINPAIGVLIAPTTLSVPTNGTGSFTATVTNDAANLGVDWTTSCTNIAGCGSITPHTASGAAATYTALPNAMLAAGSTVTVIATSTADPTISARAIVTTVTGSVIIGHVRAGNQAVSRASLSPFIFIDGTLRPLAQSSSLTGRDGAFSIAPGECPAPDAPIYLLARGGDAGAGSNASLSLLAALGPCGALRSDTPIVLNEVTTIAASAGLGGILADPTHAAPVSAQAVRSAFAAAADLADVSTGEARAVTPGGATVSQALLHTLANLLNTCAQSAGRTPVGEDACSRLFAATGNRPDAPIYDTATAAIALARAGSPLDGSDSSALLGSDSSALLGSDSSALFALAQGSRAFAPTLAAAPASWSPQITRPVSSGAALRLAPDRTVWLADGAGRLLPADPAGVPAAGPSAWISDTAASRDGRGQLWGVTVCGGDGLCPHVSASGSSTKAVIDAAGTLWVVSPQSGSLVEFPGAAPAPRGSR